MGTSETQRGSEIAINGNTAYCVVCGTSEKDDSVHIISICTKALEEHVVENIIIDLSLAEGFSTEARKLWVEFIKDHRIRRMAFFGGDIYAETTISFIVGASGVKNCQIFQSKDRALEWINK